MCFELGQLSGARHGARGSAACSGEKASLSLEAIIQLVLIVSWSIASLPIKATTTGAPRCVRPGHRIHHSRQFGRHLRPGIFACRLPTHNDADHEDHLYCAASSSRLASATPARCSSAPPT